MKSNACYHTLCKHEPDTMVRGSGQQDEQVLVKKINYVSLYFFQKNDTEGRFSLVTCSIK